MDTIEKLIFEIGRDVWIMTPKYVFCNDLLTGKTYCVTIEEFEELVKRVKDEAKRV